MSWSFNATRRSCQGRAQTKTTRFLDRRSGRHKHSAHTAHMCDRLTALRPRIRAATGEPAGIKTEPKPETLNVWKVKSDPASSAARGGWCVDEGSHIHQGPQGQAETVFVQQAVKSRTWWMCFSSLFFLPTQRPDAVNKILKRSLRWSNGTFYILDSDNRQLIFVILYSVLTLSRGVRYQIIIITGSDVI